VFEKGDRFCKSPLGQACPESLQDLDHEQPDQISKDAGDCQWVDSMDDLACHSVSSVFGIHDVCDLRCNGYHKPVRCTRGTHV